MKEDGGLGFKRLKSFNVSMLAKQAWRLINNTNPLVTKLMQARTIQIRISWMLRLEHNRVMCKGVYSKLK